MLHTYNPKAMSLLSINFQHDTILEILPGQKVLKVKVNTARSKVKSRSHHDAAHLQSPTNVPSTFQLLTSYGCQDIADKKYYRSRSLQQGQRSNPGHTVMMHTYNSQPCPYQVTTSYNLQFLRYSPDKIL